MKVQRRRGSCPSLAVPMLTGDGWLVRFKPASGLSACQLTELARAAARWGNGHVEVTVRASLQIRGLTPMSAHDLAMEIADIGIEIRDGISIETGPLAGTDIMELADPRPLAEAIRTSVEALDIADRLGPKVSVTVDGGGALPLCATAADVKLEAFRDGTQIFWQVRAGGDAAHAPILGSGDERRVIGAAVAVLESIARKGVAARARNLGEAELSAIIDELDRPNVSETFRSANPIGLFPIVGGKWARGFGLPFGQTTSEALTEFAALAGAHEIRLAPNRGLLVLGIARDEERVMTVDANRIGFITEADDPRLMVVACAGAPACASAQLATKPLAEEIVRNWRDLLDGSFRLHLSGCAKRCAQPSGPSITLVGRESDCEIAAENVVPAQDLRDILLSRGKAHLFALPGREP